MTRNDVILSAASVAAALQAVVDLRTDGAVLEVPTRGGGFDVAIADAMARSQTQAEIRASMPAILGGIRLEGISLSDKYADVAQGYLIDNTRESQAYETFSCYTNCHSACHGSRSWR